MSQAHHLHSINPQPTPGEGSTPPAPPSPPIESGRSTAKPRADKPLPTDRLRFDNQVAVLRNVATTSGNSRRGSTAEAMSAAIDLKGGTGGLNSRFFEAMHWFERVGRGEYTASPGALAWHRHLQIFPEQQYEAAAQMRDEARTSWVWETLYPILEGGSEISVKLALLELAKAAGASSHTAQLETVIDWLDWVGLVQREGDRIKLQPPGNGEVDTAVDEAVWTEDEPAEDADQERAQSDDITVPGTMSPPAGVDLEAIVSFNMSVRLTASDMKSLDADQREFLLSLAERLRG